MTIDLSLEADHAKTKFRIQLGWRTVTVEERRNKMAIVMEIELKCMKGEMNR